MLCERVVHEIVDLNSAGSIVIFDNKENGVAGNIDF